MSEGDQNKGEKLLEELEINAELTTIVEQNILPRRIAQRIGEKLKERNIRITKEQLFKLVEKIQSAIQSVSNVKPSQQRQQRCQHRYMQKMQHWMTQLFRPAI